ncbi:MAG: phage Gp37/Gp68 family protein [Planctomycetota bacterium]
MALNTSIEWTETTWNPVTGCTRFSAGCTHCYAERMARRLQAMGQANYANGFEVALHENMLELPLQWKRPQRIFVNSMSDLFHEAVPDDFIRQVFDVMNRASWHQFQVLTKRSVRLSDMRYRLPWAENIWMGVTVERADYRSRLDNLRQADAAVKFCSLEPLLGPLSELDLSGLDWVIAGGESGPGARPMAVEWVRDIRDACRAQSVPFFFKQWGGVFKKRAGRQLDGREWNQMPGEIVGNQRPGDSQ